MSCEEIDPEALRRWGRLGAELHTTSGVHRPSAFSAFLAAAIARDAGGAGSPPPLDGRLVIDAGCGAGLMTIAALEGGAARVIAQDRDPAALQAAEANVLTHAGTDGGRRVTYAESDWTELGALGGDLLVVNPPQRPARLIEATPTCERHLHDTAGEDGTEALRAVLRHAASAQVVSTMSSLIDGDPTQVGGARYEHVGPIARARVEHSEAWSSIAGHRTAWVYAQRWTRRAVTRT
ncbi:MAG: 50S ribosomal protein L11 methyltransferase [Actinomycetota bacterium]